MTCAGADRWFPRTTGATGGAPGVRSSGWSEPSDGVGVCDEDDAGETVPTTGKHGSRERGAVARDRRVEARHPTSCPPISVGTAGTRWMPWMHRPSPSGCTITTSSASACQPASSAETASVDFPAPLCPEEQQRSPVAHDRRSVEDEAAMAREQPGEWQVHTPLEEGERSKVRQVDVGPVVHHGDDEPRWCGDDDPIGLVPELDAEQLRVRRAGWGHQRASRRPRSWPRVRRASGRRSRGWRGGCASRSSSDASQCDGHACDVDDTGRHEPGEGSLTVRDHRTPGSPPNSSAPVDAVPGLLAARAPSGARRAPGRPAPRVRRRSAVCARRHCAARGRIAPVLDPGRARPVFTARAAWSRARSPADIDLEAAVRTLPTSPASIRAYNLEHTAEFRDLHAVLDAPVRALVDDDEGGVVAVNLGVFVRVTGRGHTCAPGPSPQPAPCGVGQEGGVGRGRSRPACAIICGVVDFLRCPQDGAPVLPPAQRFVLEPGDGVYIPPYAFHWTTVLDGPALGLSVGFSTTSTVRSSRVHDFDVGCAAAGCALGRAGREARKRR